MALEIGQMLFGNREAYVYRVDLIDDHQRRCVVDPHKVAFVDQQAPHPPVDRRIDVTIAQLNFGVFDGRFVGIDHRFSGIGVGLDLIVLLPGDVLFLDQLGVAPHLFAQVLHLRHIASQVRFGLLDRCLKGTRVYSEKQLALFNILPFFEMSLIQYAGDLAFHGDDRIGLNVADRPQLQRHGLLDRGSHHHRHCFPSTARSLPLASPGPGSAAGSFARFRFRIAFRFVVRPGLVLLKAGKAQHHNQECEDPERTFHSDF